MENYKFSENEVALYQAEITVEKGKGDFSVLLTNLNIVVINKIKKLFKPMETFINTYPINTVKLYNDKPHVVQKWSDVTIYLIEKELVLTFNSPIAAKTFCNKIFDLILGNTAALRGAKKVKGAIEVVDDTLGVDTVETVGAIIQHGVVGAVLGGTKNNSIVHKKPQNDDTVERTDSAIEKASLDEQIEALRKIKELLDCGVLSQEEFEAKKRQILGL